MDHTFHKFVVSCDVLESGKAYSFGADEGSNSLCVFTVANSPTLTHYDCVDISVHLSVDKRDVIKHVDALILDGFDRGRTTAEHSWDERRKKKGYNFEFWGDQRSKKHLTKGPVRFLTHLRSFPVGSDPKPASRSFQIPDPAETSSTPPTHGSSCGEKQKSNIKL